MTDRSKDAPERLYMHVARRLQQSIRLGHYPVNSRLPSEREIADAYGVSRPTIREATIVLELRGLVEMRHRAGVYVIATEPEEVESNLADNVGPFEVTEARRLFEGEAAALAAGTIEQAELTELEDLLSQMAEDELDQSIRERADRDFHLTLARATRNEAIVSVVQTLWDKRYSSPLCAYLFSLAKQIGIQPPVEDHRRILAALQARDPEGARQAMRAHLTRVTESLYRATEHDARERTRLKMDERRHVFARRAGVSEPAE
ncbi:FadR/GntR family transcriptional regulator [Sphingomonas citri]|uniref:FadR family transcriptional regulator n=1 Tax=Sphingomonas citri TaxID=2862499 RepID=A0ABS7BLB9_9SPHN|nr:FadR/GntR family transcriptional regulator [Sphingomonas citri]MBW6530318.1 FadR family transcriptional regulator [Sphingomonas citri]